MKNSNAFRPIAMCFVLAAAACYSQAQQTTPLPYRPRPALPITAPVVAPANAPAPPSNLSATPKSDTEINLTWEAATETGGTIDKYDVERCNGSACIDFKQIGTPTDTKYSDTGLGQGTTYLYRVNAVDNSGAKSPYSNVSPGTTLPPSSSWGVSCLLLPTRPGCMDYGQGISSNINTFYSTDGQWSFLNQIKSIYNGASGSATVSANVVSLNFPNGMQGTVVTNVQAGSSGSAAITSGTVPTLSANGAAQAAQNMLYGGTIYAAVLYPVWAKGASKPNTPGNFGTYFDLVAREGADLQNFKSGTNVNVNSPPSHSNVQLEGYLQYNSINLTAGNIYAGALFLGGSYGWSYTSHGYARDYGFGNRVNNDIGQVSLGVLINGVAKISVSRAFGPPQVYIDSTSMAQTRVNNFKAWSFGITYQSAPPTK